ncbi:MAG: DUF1801 domain-containing protein [Bacteroidales bacterium]|jgi:uncharacterized protein YdhG (YjbR/CyaY superfamily)|nr:DUF1801 domain-containing protein [Bacteroidales bacterium]
MQYEAKSPKEYLEELENDWRKTKLKEIREMILSNGPELEEDIEYKMLCYRLGQESVFNLNAQKAYVSLYVGNIDKIDGSRELLHGFEMGKGCIRVKKSVDLSETKLDEFIAKTIHHWKMGGETNC